MTKKNKKIIILIVMFLLLFLELIVHIYFTNYSVVASIIGGVFFTLITFYLIDKRTLYYTNVPDNNSLPSSFISNDQEGTVNEEVMDWAMDRENEIKQLKANEKFRKEFIGNVAHELKTPIFNIQGYILTLLDGGWKDKKISKKYLERTERNVQRLLSLITDLDTITQVESGRLKMHKTHFNIISLIEEIFEMQEINRKKRNITLTFMGNFKADETYVYADEEKIFEVLLNLIENSVKYGIDDGETKVRVSQSDKKISIEISDNGIGISKEHIHRVFERFYRVDKSRSREMGGSGLGLAIVKHIIEAHKQKISVKSKNDTGTTFAFTLESGDKEKVVVNELDE